MAMAQKTPGGDTTAQRPDRDVADGGLQLRTSLLAVTFCQEKMPHNVGPPSYKMVYKPH